MSDEIIGEKFSHSGVISNDQENNKSIEAQAVTLETLIDDCLRYIFLYLDSDEAAKLALTCTKLHDFAKTCIFTREYKEIALFIRGNYYSYETETRLPMLRSEFRYRGFFVTHVRVKTNRYKGNVMKLFPNLENVHFEYMAFLIVNEMLKNLSNNVRSMKIEAMNSRGNAFVLTDLYYEALKPLSKLTHLLLIGPYTRSNGNLFKSFKSLTNLTLEFYNYEENGCTEDLEILFELNSHCMQHFDMKYSYCHPSISGALIAKLHKLESLAVNFLTKSLIKSLRQLNHLKSLTISCRHRSINALMRVLSKVGIIENLNIEYGTYENDEVDNEPRLIFKNLKTFQCYWYKHSAIYLLNVLTKSKMPEIQRFQFSSKIVLEDDHKPTPYYAEEASLGLLKLIRSKKTLTLLDIRDCKGYYEFYLVRQIIDILKMPCTPRRPILNLKIHHLHIGDEEVR